MLTIISGTNRKGSLTYHVAKNYETILQEMGKAPKLISLHELSPDFFFPDMYDTPNVAFAQFEAQLIHPTRKFIFVVPEYNGSFPGALKLFIDACGVKKSFHGKKACLVGVSSGRAGNIVGLAHMTVVLNHVKIDVYHNKLKLSHIEDLLGADGRLIDAPSIALAQKQLAGFLEF